MVRSRIIGSRMVRPRVGRSRMFRSRMVRSRMIPLALASAIAWACGCDDPQSAVDVSLEVDECTASLTERVELLVFDPAGELVERFERNAASFPTGVRVEQDNEEEFAIVARLYADSPRAIAEVRLRAEFEPGLTERALYVHDDCLGVLCVGDASCEEGQCVDADAVPVRETALPQTRARCPMIVEVPSGCGGSCVTDAIETVADVGGLIELGGGTYPALSIRDTSRHVTLRARDLDDRPVFDGTGFQNAVDVLTSDVTLDGIVATQGEWRGFNVNASMTADYAHIEFRRCLAHDNGSVPGGFNDYGGLTLNNFARDVLIEASEFRDNVDSFEPAERTRTAGIHVNKGAGRIVIRGNEIRGNASHGINVSETDDAIVVNNVIAENGAAGLVLSARELPVRGNRVCANGSGAWLQGSVSFTNNSVVGNRDVAVQVDGEPELANNVFAFNEGAAVAISSGDPRDHDNLYFDNGAGEFARDEPETDLEADPRFVSSMFRACELVPSADSPMRDRGLGAL